MSKPLKGQPTISRFFAPKPGSSAAAAEKTQEIRDDGATAMDEGEGAAPPKPDAKQKSSTVIPVRSKIPQKPTTPAKVAPKSPEVKQKKRETVVVVDDDDDAADADITDKQDKTRKKEPKRKRLKLASSDEEEAGESADGQQAAKSPPKRKAAVSLRIC